MKGIDWKKRIKKMGTDQLKELMESINKLEGWTVFRKEFQWTGIFTLRTMIRIELRIRGVLN